MSCNRRARCPETGQVVGREGFEPPQLSRVVYSHLSSPMPSRPTYGEVMVPNPDNPPVARGYARYVLAVMVGINFLNYMDRWVASAAATSIEKEFHLTNSQLGLIGTSVLPV